MDLDCVLFIAFIHVGYRYCIGIQGRVRHAKNETPAVVLAVPRLVSGPCNAGIYDRIFANIRRHHLVQLLSEEQPPSQLAFHS